MAISTNKPTMPYQKKIGYKDRYYDERFAAMTTLLNSHMILITEKLDKIETQTTKTNGRVTHLEDFQRDAQRVIDTREINCPVVEKLDKKIEVTLSEKYSDLQFILRHPKLFVGAIVVMVLVSLFGLIESHPFGAFEKHKTEVIK